MTRSPATIVVLAWSSWDATRFCLESLRPTLGVRDQVVVVDDGSSQGAGMGLRHYPWVEVVSLPDSPDPADQLAEAVGKALHGIIVFLDSETVLAHHWLDPLIAAFDDSSVGAAGPRSNFVSGPQLVSSASYSSRAELRQFARRWATDHRGRVSETTRLGGFCLAVRGSVLVQTAGWANAIAAGGIDGDEISRRITEAGYRMVIRHDSFVHRNGQTASGVGGSAGRHELRSSGSRFDPEISTMLGSTGRAVRLSACLIVKDEEGQLPDCLEALKGIPDEIVVYDTGSSDRSVEVARSFGATVLDGYWDDHFARARNAALDHCTGDWILWVDADEVLRTQPGFDLKAVLAHTNDAVDAWSVVIRNAVGGGASSEILHHGSRLFRRARCEWAGRIHEQVVRRGDAGVITQGQFNGEVWIDHSGYLSSVIERRNKTERNIRVAQAELAQADGWERGFSLTSLARSLMMGGKLQEALDSATEAADVSDNPVTLRLAIRTAVEATLELGRLDESLDWCKRLAMEGGDPATVRFLEASVRMAKREWGPAWRLLDTLPPDGFQGEGAGVSKGVLAAKRAQVLEALNRHGEAADQLLDAMNDQGTIDTHLGSLIDLMLRSGRPLELLAQAIPQQRVVLFMAQLLQLQPGIADQVLDACVSSGVHTMHVLAAASKLGPRLPVDRALLWSARLRAAGNSESCPLMAIAGTSEDPVLRARAAVTAHAAFRDPESVPLFRRSFEAADAHQRAEITAEAAALSPAMLAECSIVTTG